MKQLVDYDQAQLAGMAQQFGLKNDFTLPDKTAGVDGHATLRLGREQFTPLGSQLRKHPNSDGASGQLTEACWEMQLECRAAEARDFSSRR